MGQVLHSKGVDLLARAYLQLANVHTRVSLEIWGGTDSQPGYIASLESLLDQAPHAAIRGRYEPSQVGSLLQDIDVLVVPSRWPEIGPLTLLEAFATRTPVIAARIGNMPELVDHGQNGLLFDAGSVSDLAHQMRRILEEPDLYDRLRARIPQVRSPDDEMREIVGLYTRVQKAGPGGVGRPPAELE
jgi:glycosyltransferase involved in cell wall biosynthesis